MQGSRLHCCTIVHACKQASVCPCDQCVWTCSAHRGRFTRTRSRILPGPPSNVITAAPCTSQHKVSSHVLRLGWHEQALLQSLPCLTIWDADHIHSSIQASISHSSDKPLPELPDRQSDHVWMHDSAAVHLLNADEEMLSCASSV